VVIIMRNNLVSFALIGIIGLVGCQTSKSSNPLSPTVAGPIPGVNITAPSVMAPAPNAQIAIDQQPITLTVKNATTNGVRPLSYEFQVSGDSSFGTQLFAKTGIAPGANGQTSIVMPDKLGDAGNYFWRSRAEDGANTGAWTSAVPFSVYIPVVIQAPTPVQPAAGATTSSVRPSFVVTNATRTGPAGTIHYNLAIAQDITFAQIALTATFPEGNGQTTMAIGQDLSASGHYYWRVQASDGKNDGPWSNAIDFRTPAAPAPPPTPSPTPTPSPGGPGVAADQINMSAASIYNSPTDLASWNVSTAITSVNFGGDGISVQFSKKDGSGRWPDVTPPGWDGPLEYTLGMCLNIGGQWGCSAVIEAWNGLDPLGGPPSQIGQNWFYDPLRWGPMAHHQPAPGETIGIFVCEGDCRNNTQGTSSPLRERSNVVLVKFPG
jgi:hypothetical protein